MGLRKRDLPPTHLIGLLIASYFSPEGLFTGVTLVLLNLCVGRDNIGVLFEWYGESGGQLKYYPFASNAKWASVPFQLEPLPDAEGYGILAKASAYFPQLWEEISREF
jgi:hypothetical protein